MSSSFNSSKSGSSVVVSMEEVFNKFDENGDGLISSDELKNVFRKMGPEMKPEEVQPVISKFDKDGDGHIDLEEFTKIMNGSRSSKDLLDALRDAFNMYDLDKNGLISTSELHEVLNRLGEKCSVAECATMITKFDVNGDGFINFEEFKQMMNRS